MLKWLVKLIFGDVSRKNPHQEREEYFAKQRARWNHGICPDNGEQWSGPLDSVNYVTAEFFPGDPSNCDRGLREQFNWEVVNEKPDLRRWEPSWREVHHKEGHFDYIYWDTPPEEVKRRREEVLGKDYLQKALEKSSQEKPK